MNVLFFMYFQMIDSSFSYLDIILGVFLLIGVIRGLKTGFIRTITSLLAWIVGIYVAIHFSYFLLDYLEEYLSWNAETLNITAFILTLIIVVILFSIIGQFLTQLSKLLALGLLNRLLGGVFGLLKSALILSVLLMFVSSFNSGERFIKQKDITSSKLYKPLEKFGEKILPSIMDKIEEHTPKDLDFNFFEEEPLPDSQTE